MAEIKYLVFALGEQKYGLKLSTIKGIEHDYSVVPVPVGAQYMKGIIHLRGEIVPLFNLKEKLQMPDVKGKDVQLLVTETHGIKIGLEVDEVVGIFEIDEEDIRTVPMVVLSDETGYLENVVRIKLSGKMEIILSIAIDGIMSSSEFESVSSAIEEMAQDKE